MPATTSQRRSGSVVSRTVCLAAATVLAIAGCSGNDSADSEAQPTQLSLPAPDLSEHRTWSGALTINGEDVEVELDGANAPQAVANFVYLAQAGYYDDTECHRLVTQGIYILQCGDPTATGMGGPGYTFGPVENAPDDAVYRKGVVAMARTGAPDSMGSQFFIVYEDSPIHHDAVGGYTVFGTVTSGLDVIEAVADAGVQPGTTTPVDSVTIEGVEVS